MAERRPYSLAARLALITAVWSAVALLVTGVILTELFRSDAERGFDIRIEADLVHLVRDAATRPAGEPALNKPGRISVRDGKHDVARGDFTGSLDHAVEI